MKRTMTAAVALTLAACAFSARADDPPKPADQTPPAHHHDDAAHTGGHGAGQTGGQQSGGHTQGAQGQGGQPQTPQGPAGQSTTTHHNWTGVQGGGYQPGQGGTHHQGSTGQTQTQGAAGAVQGVGQGSGHGSGQNGNGAHGQGSGSGVAGQSHSQSFTTGQGGAGAHNGARSHQPRARDQGRQWFSSKRFAHSYSAQRHFNGPNFRNPSGWRYQRWAFGQFLPFGWFTSNYYLNWYAFGLPQPPIGCEWVREGSDAVLVDVWSGEVLSVYYDLFY